MMDGDEAVYGSIAALVNTGAALYGPGGVDNKPPGVFWVYGATFRFAGNYDMTAIHAVGLAFILATCALLFVIGREMSCPRAGLLAALFYGVLTAAGNPRLLATNTEALMMLPLVASVLLIVRRHWMWSGLLLVLAGAFRQVAAVNVLLAVAGILWLEPAGARRRPALLFAGGIAGGLLIGAMALLLTGSLSGFWRWTVQSLYGYASTSWEPAYVWLRAKDSIVPFVVDMLVLWIAAVALASQWRELPAPQRLALAWLVIAMIGSVAAGHLSWHYFIQAMAPLALVAGLYFDRANLRRLVVSAAAVGIAVPTLAWWTYDLGADPLTYDFAPPVPQHELVASYIDSHTASSDRIFVWGDWPALYVESDRLMSSRFPGFLRGFERGSSVAPNNWDTTPDVWPALQVDLDAHPPALIVDTASAGWSDFSSYPMSDYPVLAAIVAARYHLVATIGGVNVYARN